MEEDFVTVLGQSRDDQLDYLKAGAHTADSITRFEADAIKSGELSVFMIERAAISNFDEIRDVDQAVKNRREPARHAVLVASRKKILLTFFVLEEEGSADLEKPF